ncbi:MAG TPA: hypothetical protein VFZ59_26380 [Verrucomicrobiae bacterium]|nr:hypothetical protein [Verrucomicrobiae bacterium]
MATFIKHGQLEMRIGMATARARDVLLETLDGQFLPVDHPESLSEDERQIGAIRGEGAKSFQVFTGTADFVPMTQSPRRINQRLDVLWIPGSGLDEQTYRLVKTVGRPKTTGTL